VLAKSISEGGGKSRKKLDLAVRQIVSLAISSDKVIDIFDAAGLKKPDISILSDEFLTEVKHLPQRNLAVELLQRLLNNELKSRVDLRGGCRDGYGCVAIHPPPVLNFPV